jgi:hypothetical protein
MKFILLYRVIGQFIVFVSLILMVWGGLLLIIKVFLRIFIIARYQVCGIWALAALGQAVPAGHVPLQLH